MKLDSLVAELDDYLQTHEYDDRSNNGLQVEGSADVQRVGFAVDASLEAFRQAAEAGVDLLVVHHGLFWGEPIMVTAAHRARLALLLQSGISLYAAHLPLDGHQEIGNNVEMARLLGLTPIGGLGLSAGRPIGTIAETPAGTTVESLRASMSEVLGAPVHTWPFRETAGRVGLVMGKATSLIPEAIDLGLDAILCGELEHMVYHQAREAGLAAVLGGHYHTETVGLKALARRMQSVYGLETVWIEVPTGL